MDTSELIRVLEQYRGEAAKGHLQALVLTTDTGFLPEGLEDWCRSTSQDFSLLRHAHLQDSFLPYVPLSDWLRKEHSVSGVATATGLDAAGAYTLHRDILGNWLEGRTPQRSDLFLPQEADFEQVRFRATFLSLLDDLVFSRPRLVIIEQAQSLGRGTLELLGQWVQSGRNQPVLLVLTMKLGLGDEGDSDGDFWTGFWELWEDRKLGSQVWISGTPPGVFRRLDLGDRDEALRRLEMLLEFFCWDDARELGLRLSGASDQDPGMFTEPQRRRLYSLLGELDLRQGDGVGAQTHWSHLLALADSTEEKARVWGLMAWGAGIMRDRKEMDPWLEKLLKLQSQGRLSRDQSWFLGFLRLWAENLEPRLEYGDWKSLYRETIALGQDLNRTNSTAYWLVYPSRMTSLDSLSEAAYFQDWGMAECEKMGNTLRLSDAYLTRGHFWSLRGDWDKVLEAYKQAENLKVALGGNQGELASIYNGRGFFLMETGNFAAAQDSFYQALQCLKNQLTFKEIALTLFNLGTNYFRAGAWMQSESCLTSLLKLMSLLDMNNLVFHSRREVMVLLALVCLKLRQPVRAYDLWLRIQASKESLRTEAEMVWYWILAGWIRHYEGDQDRALAAFQEGRSLLGPEKHYLQFSVPYFWYEMGLFFREIQRAGDAVLAFKQGYQASFQFPNFYIRGLLDQALGSGKGPAPVLDLGPLRLDFDWIIESGRTDKALRALRSRNHALETLHHLLSLISGNRKEKELLTAAVNLFQRAFFFDHMVLYRKTGHSWIKIFSSDGAEEDPSDPWDRLLPVLRAMGDRIYINDPKAHPELAPWKLPYPALLSVQGHYLEEYSLHFIGILPGQNSLLSEEVQTLHQGVALLADHLGQEERIRSLERELRELHRGLKNPGNLPDPID